MLLKWLLKLIAEEALAGDLLEQANRGKGEGWLWRQVWIAIGYRLLKRRAELTYALAGCSIQLLALPYANRIRPALHWWELPYPLSLVVFDMSPPFLLALVAGLVVLMDKRFGFSGYLRTWLWSGPMLMGLNYPLREAIAILKPHAGGLGETALFLTGLAAMFSGLYFCTVLGRGQLRGSDQGGVTPEARA